MDKVFDAYGPREYLSHNVPHTELIRFLSVI